MAETWDLTAHLQRLLVVVLVFVVVVETVVVVGVADRAFVLVVVVDAGIGAMSVKQIRHTRGGERGGDRGGENVE